MSETKKFEPNQKFLTMVAENKSECWIAIDNRERAVLEYNTHFSHLPYRPMQMTVGDYAICRGQKILAVIERKSLEDYAASLKDGRHNNKNKMTKLRDEIGCRVVYIVEGPLDPPQDRLYGKTPYKWIENSIFHIMIRDHILVIRTKDPLDTSKKLARFCESMSTIEWEPSVGLDLTTGLEIVGSSDLINAHASEILTADRSKSDSDILRELWACFKGITIESAEHYIKKWSISDIILNKVTKEDLLEFKINNRHISKSTQAGLLNVSKDMHKRLLACIPGISNITADEILSQMNLDILLEIGLSEIQLIKVGKKKVNLGEIKSKRILKLFNDTEM